MKYTFEILGISPVLDFFNHQQKFYQRATSVGIEYLGTYQCTLDAFLESVETVSPKGGWELDRVVDTVIQFWMNHSEPIRYWQGRLNDAGQENLLVARVADIQSLKAEFESLLGNNS
jgi:plasmid maintenance system antidote protein VapI